MSSFRNAVCEFYICKGKCSKGKEAEHYKVCQKCTKYKPGTSVIKEESKRTALNKIQEKEFRKEAKYE